jgi:raffinose/stachyose/melibiose transport system substrate-binding protein
MKALVAALAVILVFLTGCQPVPHAVLQVWDTFAEKGQDVAMDGLVTRFMKTYPTIDVYRSVRTFDQIRATFPEALTSEDAPDVFTYDNGPSYAARLAKANLLLPLDEAYVTMGWNDRLLPWTKERTVFAGTTYGIGNEIEYLGVFYNKALFAKLGAKPPTTYQEFLHVCEVAKAAGYTALEFADGPKWPAYHQFSVLANGVLGCSTLEGLLSGKQSWDQPAVAEVIDLAFVRPQRARYFPADAVTASYEKGTAVFAQGRAAMFVTGTWIISELKSSVKDFDVGFFPFPSVEGKPAVLAGGLGSGYYISARTKVAEQAKLFLDFLFSAENGRVWLEDMDINPPLAVDTDRLNLSPLLKEALKTSKSVATGYNIDVLAGPEFNKVQAEGFAAVLMGTVSPETQARNLQAAWAKDQAGL